jgi:hypothetical protein
MPALEQSREAVYGGDDMEQIDDELTPGEVAANMMAAKDVRCLVCAVAAAISLSIKDLRLLADKKGGNPSPPDLPPCMLWERPIAFRNPL